MCNNHIFFINLNLELRENFILNSMVTDWSEAVEATCLGLVKAIWLTVDWLNVALQLLLVVRLLGGDFRCLFLYLTKLLTCLLTVRKHIITFFTIRCRRRNFTLSHWGFIPRILQGGMMCKPFLVLLLEVLIKHESKSVQFFFVHVHFLLHFK